MTTNRYIARLIRHESTSMVNICDEELLGKTVKGKGLEIHISKSYFGGDQVNLDEALGLIRKSHSANLAGTRIVEQVVKANMGSRLAVKKIGSVLFLMIFKFNS